MNMKKKMTVHRLLSGALVLLGYGNWYLGTYEYNMEIKLSKEDK